MALAKCGAKKRQGRGRCARPAGWGTKTHVGQGRCKLHGGCTPITHGRYSTITREPIRKLIEQYQGDARPLDLLPELASARAIFHDFIERYDLWSEALLAWHASQAALAELDAPTTTGKPRQILDIADARNCILAIVRIVETIERIRAADHISRADFTRIMTEMGRVVDRFVESPEILDKIKDGWLSIRL